MISGFNTDIEFENTVYHVQTEDKGLRSQLIVSLVYDKGTILASKRASYDDLALGKFDEKELTDRVNRQHKLMCAAVRAGRIGELQEMTRKERARSTKAAAEVSTSQIAMRVAGTPLAVGRIEIAIKDVITVYLNGEIRLVEAEIDLVKLLEIFALPSQRIAIELNKTVVRRSDWPHTVIGEGDRIEVVHFVGGG